MESISSNVVAWVSQSCPNVEPMWGWQGRNGRDRG